MQPPDVDLRVRLQPAQSESENPSIAVGSGWYLYQSNTRSFPIIQCASLWVCPITHRSGFAIRRASSLTTKLMSARSWAKYGASTTMLLYLVVSTGPSPSSVGTTHFLFNYPLAFLPLISSFTCSVVSAMGCLIPGVDTAFIPFAPVSSISCWTCLGSAS